MLTNYNAAIVEADYSPGVGITTDGSTKAVTSGTFFPGAYTQNARYHLGIYLADGVGKTTSVNLAGAWGGTNTFWGIDAGVGSVTTNGGDYSGLILMTNGTNAAGTNDSRVTQRAESVVAGSLVATIPSTTVPIVWAGTNNGTPQNFTVMKLQGGSFGSHLGTEQAYAYSRIWDELAASLGRVPQIPMVRIGGIIGCGQSLMVGGSTSVSVTAPAYSYALAAGGNTRHVYNVQSRRVVPVAEHRTIATADYGAFAISDEIPAGTSFAAAFQANATTGTGTVVGVSAIGATSLAALSRGTLYWQGHLVQTTDMARLLGPRFIGIRAAVMKHGEQDDGTLTQAQYASGLQTYLSNMRTDLKAITGQSYDFPLVVSQHCSWGSTKRTSTTAPAMLDAHKAGAGIFLSGPDYVIPHTDGTHVAGTGYRWLGEYLAKAYASIEATGTWEPLRPLSVLLSGANLTVVFTKGGLVWDTTLVSDPSGSLASKIGSTNVNVTNYRGFEFIDGTGSVAPTAVITGASITTTTLTSDTVVFTLDTTPSGANPRLRAAYTATAGGGPTSGPRTNLRDADVSFTSPSSNTMYNWCIIFDEPVVIDSVSVMRAYMAGDVPPGMYPWQLSGQDLILSGSRPPHEAAAL